ncbi:hypothetical protein DCAR_0727016 [Daucus carota subsp. sativus]|uniref:Epidermal patterning factor-like protein n=1 Tax=Daucus carota subsp. sativus TaxID=79200 RepID=A0AAF0XIT9_DAUCS|nr:hypothetical protein DCAR_0727016 [Daucus carota subsp. sativus]
MFGPGGILVSFSFFNTLKSISAHIRTDRSEMSRLGSRPPNCDHGCGECKPCVAVQVPTNDMQLQSPNYGPEEWSCRCGSSFFTP